MLRWFPLAVLLSIALPAVASAVTLDEADLPDGDFSDDFLNPTEIPSGVDLVTGARNGTEDFDYFVFTGLPSGIQLIEFDFAPATPLAPDEFSFNAGGGLRFDFDGFSNPFDGIFAGQATIGFFNQAASLVIETPDSFDGDLFVSFNFTNGENLAYNITLPSSSNAVVPLPASLPLLALGVLATGLIARRRAPSSQA